MNLPDVPKRDWLGGSVKQKGLLIIAVPVLLQIVCLSLLINQNIKLQEQAAKQATYTQLLLSSGKLMSCSFDLVHFINKFLHTHSHDDLTRARYKMDELDHVCQAIRKQEIDDASAQQHRSELDRTASEVVQIFHRAENAISKPLDIGAACTLFEDRKRLVELIPMFVKQANLLSAVSSHLVEDASRVHLKMAEIERNIVYAGALSAAMFGFFAWNVFGRTIQNRIAVIKDNTRRPAAKEMLLPPVSGSDEIQELDQSFRGMAEALRVAEEELRASELRNQQMRSEFYSMIAHDIRSPLLSIKSGLFMSTVADAGTLPNETIDRLRSCERNVDRIANLINDLLDIDKYESGKFGLCPTKVETGELVRAAADTVRELVTAKSLKIVEKVEDANLLADRDLVVRVLTNLLSNAIKFSPENGEVTIQAKHAREDEIMFVVADRGPGIAPDHLPLLFQRFNQVPDGTKVASSSGLGLAICKMIVEEHDGRIGVNSKIGEGSEFWFTIPCVHD